MCYNDLGGLEMSNLKITDNLEKKIKMGVSFALVGTMIMSAGRVNTNITNNKRHHQLRQTKTLMNEETAVYTGVNIYVDGLPFTPTDVDGNEVLSFAYAGTTYMPVRAIATALGAKVDWKAEENAVMIWTDSLNIHNNTTHRNSTTLQQKNLSIVRGVKLFVNEQETILTDVNGNIVEPLVVNGTTYLPVRAIADLFKVGICWNQVQDGKDTYSNVYIHKIYPNLSQETNDMLITCVNQLDQLRPHLGPMKARQLRSLDLYTYCYQKSQEMKKWNEEVNSIELQTYLDKINDYFNNVMATFNATVQNMVSEDQAIGNKQIIFSLSPTITEEELKSSIAIFEYYAETAQITYDTYQAIYTETEPEQLQKYYDEIDNMYQSAKTIYNSLIKAKTIVRQ